MIRLFVPQKLAPGLVLEPSQQQIHYLLHVMRKKEGGELLVFNGIDGEWVCKVTSIQKRSCQLEVVSKARCQIVEEAMWLLFPPLKSKAQEYLIEKATEVGVTHFQPILTQRTVVTRFNEVKARAQAIEAAEQSERLTVPEFGALRPLTKILEEWDANKTLYVGDETHESEPLMGESVSGDVGFMVGPEGGWTEDELKLLNKNNSVKTVDLGVNILRAETAAVVGLSTLLQKKFLK